MSCWEKWTGTLKAIWSVACLDLCLWRRMPVAIASALVPPIAMALFLVVLSLAVTQQPVALVIQGSGQNADRMALIINEDTDAYLPTRTDEARAKQMLSDQEVAAVITVPQDFDQMIKNGRVAKVKLLLNNVDTDFADDIRRSVDRSVYRFALEKSRPPTKEEMDLVRSPPRFETPEDEAKEAEIMLRAVHGDNPYLIKIDEQDLRKTNVQWLNYQVIPVLLLLILNVGLVGTALLCAQDIERKTAIYLLLTPQNSWTLVAGKLLGGFILCILVLVPALSICVVLGTVSPPPAHWPALAAIFAATGLFAASAGAIIGVTMKGARSIAMAACIIATYLFLLGGGFTTIAFLPEWLRMLSSLVPTRYAIDGMRQALFYSTLDGVPADLLILIVTAILFSILSSVFLRRAWLQK